MSGVHLSHRGSSCLARDLHPPALWSGLDLLAQKRLHSVFESLPGIKSVDRGAKTFLTQHSTKSGCPRHRGVCTIQHLAQTSGPAK